MQQVGTIYQAKFWDHPSC